MRFIATWAVLVAVLLARRGWDEMPSGNEIDEPEPRTTSRLAGVGEGRLRVRGTGGALSSYLCKTIDNGLSLEVGRVVRGGPPDLQRSALLRGLPGLGRAIGLTDVGSVVAFVGYCGFFSLSHVLSWGAYLELGANGLVRTAAEPDPTAWGLRLLAYAAAVRSRWWLAAPLAGLATTVHVLVGLQLGVPLLAYGIYLAATARSR